MDNPYADAKGGAGPKAANLLAEKKVKMIIAGQFGDKVADMLKAKKIKYVEKQGVVIDAVKEQIHAK